VLLSCDLSLFGLAHGSCEFCFLEPIMMRSVKQAKHIAAIVATYLLLDAVPTPCMRYNLTTEMQILDPFYGRGRGSRGFKCQKPVRQEARDVWGIIFQANDNHRLQDAIHLNIEDFTTFLEDLQESGLDEALGMYSSKLCYLPTRTGCHKTGL
jgi:hypothetical protein